MRAYRLTLVTVCGAGLLTLAAAKADVAPADLLRLTPAQRDLPFDFDTPATPEEIAACKASIETDKNTGGFSYTLKDGQGRLLRRFSDTNGKKDDKGKSNLDQWSYFKDGFEVYREVDLNEDKFADECRWLNSGGTRIALLKSNHIVGWKRISAEEASKILVQALVSNNLPLLDTVLATPAELSALGIPKVIIDRETQARNDRAGAVAALRKTLVGWDSQTAWMRFDGSMPHVIPGDAGLKDDLVLYENAFIFAGPPTGEVNPMKIAYLQCPDVVKIGETWKFVGLPRAINPAEPTAVAFDAGIRPAVYQNAVDSGTTSSPTPESEQWLKKLAEHDGKAPGLDASKQDVATYHYQRIEILKEILQVAASDIDRVNYTRQVIDSLAAAYQTGLYPPAKDVLTKYAQTAQPIGSYAAYRKALAEYTLEANEPGANFIQVQKNYLDKLDEFLKKYAESEEVPEVLFQLASINEFNAEEEKAREYYGRLAQQFKEDEAGKKAAGAIRRLDIVGKPLDVSGPALNGKTVSTSQFKGKPILVTFWTSTADPVRRDLPELLKVYQKYKPKGFEIVGVNLDPDKAILEGFLKENPLPWVQIFEPGGMDSRLANEFGVITLPTMILTDAEGKVVSRNVRNAADLDRFLEKLLATSGSAAINLGGTR